MINLIPPKGHKTIKYEYFFRVGATIGFLFTGTFLFLSVTLIPTYVLVGAQINAYEAEQQKENTTDEILQTADREVQITKETLAQFKRVSESSLASEAIVGIKNTAPSSILFSNFIIDASGGVIETVQVQGKAPTREALAQLKISLESSDMFESAEVPISDLARDVDVPFAIIVTLSKK